MSADRNALIIDGCAAREAKASRVARCTRSIRRRCSRKYSTPFRIGAHDVDDVVVGKNSNDGDHSACIGRLSVLPAGWPVEAPGSTINGFCGSGEQAIALGAMGIRAGYQDLVVAGGLESMPRITFDVKSGSPEAGNRALLDRYR
jgi:acetyl-CoA acetyltransferase